MITTINPDWLEHLSDEFEKEYFIKLMDFVKLEYKTEIVYPPKEEIFSALQITPLSKVKVVILGQDPYHDEGQAHGLCFSVKPDIGIPKSLINIYKELQDDTGCSKPNDAVVTFALALR